MHKQNFAGINVEVGANWVEGVNGDKLNPHLAHRQLHPQAQEFPL
jgi:hypothetical protein